MWKILAVIGVGGLLAGYGLGWAIFHGRSEPETKTVWMREDPVIPTVAPSVMSGLKVDENFSRNILQQLDLYEKKNYMLTKCVENAVMAYNGVEMVRGLLLDRIDNLTGKLEQYSLRAGNEDADFTEIVKQIKAIREIGSSDGLREANLEMMESFRSALRVNEVTGGSGNAYNQGSDYK